MTAAHERPIERLLARFEASYAPLAAAGDAKLHFCGVYLRSTYAVRDELDSGGFADAEWVERWDVVFANLYLDALDMWQSGGAVPGPWRLAFESAEQRDLPPLRHQLIGLNAHLNFDLPQAVISVMADDDFDQPDLLARRHRDFRHIDTVMLRRIPEEYRRRRTVERPADSSRVDRLLYPLNVVASRRWLVEARRKVWHNARELSTARRAGDAALAARVQELEQLATSKVAELLRPGQVLLRLAVTGFGVKLPPLPPDAAADRPTRRAPG